MSAFVRISKIRTFARMDPETLIRKLFLGRGRDVHERKRRFTYFVLGYPNGEPPRHAPEHGDHGVFFVDFFQSISGEAGRGARLWLVSFFYADKSAP